MFIGGRRFRFNTFCKIIIRCVHGSWRVRCIDYYGRKSNRRGGKSDRTRWFFVISRTIILCRARSNPIDIVVYRVGPKYTIFVYCTSFGALRRHNPLAASSQPRHYTFCGFSYRKGRLINY